MTFLLTYGGGCTAHAGHTQGLCTRRVREKLETNGNIKYLYGRVDTAGLFKTRPLQSPGTLAVIQKKIKTKTELENNYNKYVTN